MSVFVLGLYSWFLGTKDILIYQEIVS